MLGPDTPSGSATPGRATIVPLPTLGVSRSPDSGFELQATAALTHASGLHDDAPQMRAHAQTFASGSCGLAF